ncbi:6035_t:CDS:2 [Entrophospora sp. SA101]|nr:6035_t:CDS:2 [Entrophospora sp. SA101]
MIKRPKESSNDDDKTSCVKSNKRQQTSLTSWLSPKPAPPIKVEGLEIKNKELLSLELKTISNEWLKILLKEIQEPYFIELKKFLEGEKKKNRKIFPPDVYSWSRMTLPFSVKVVIIGQDPYHGVGQAHGLCFSVPHKVTPPPSLVNIYKALKYDIESFKIPNHGNLSNWANEGVLLLNTSLTVRAHEPENAVIQYLNNKKSGLVFMLWGNHAIKKGKNINKEKHCVLQAVHPSPLSAPRGFFNCKHWSKANEYLKANV